MNEEIIRALSVYLYSKFATLESFPGASELSFYIRQFFRDHPEYVR